MKRIIVLSDGTGNSSHELAKSNVWRTYLAIDLSRGDQIAQYDDGVGTSSVRPLAILGGAFGWGLKRNVLHLYKFLCRNYEEGEEGEEGDEIYGFGFSRGAFTIRVLIGLVTSQGLVRMNSEEELEMLANAAYRDYRAKSYKRDLSLSRLGRPLRNMLIAIQNHLLGNKEYDWTRNRQVKSIRFLGLWDTVDAYGMPVKELKAGIDKYIWPLLFDSDKPHPKIDCGRQALALDDERSTFHPLVWDETAEVQGSTRIRQVWFPGMHADVGGGYFEDSAAYVPLLWMLDEAVKQGLRLKRPIVNDYRVAASPLGPLHDSRAGAASYYRYSPRLVKALCEKAAINIDPCVQYRIANGGDQYAPISMPAPPGQSLDYEMAWDTVWWRRFAYWAMLGVTFVLASLALITMKIWWTDDWASVVVDPLIGSAADAVFGPLKNPVRHIGESPTAALGFLFIIVACFLWGRLLAGRIRDRAEEMWGHRSISNQKVWAEQSMQRWRANSLLAVSVAVGLLIAAIYLQALIIAAGIFLLVTIAFAVWRRWYDQRRVERMKADPEEIRGWTLRLACTLRNSALMITIAKKTSHYVTPFFFAMGLIAGALYALWRLLRMVGLFGS
jgi:uncharacterized protein (DUF2235 family)